MPRGLDAFFYGFTGIINHSFYQSDRAYYLSYFIYIYNIIRELRLGKWKTWHLSLNFLKLEDEQFKSV